MSTTPVTTYPMTSHSHAPQNHRDAQSQSPNILWIFGDQHRAQALSCMGDPNVYTPNLDAVAGRGATAVAGSPLCTPFRGSLLTSRYPHECAPAHDDPVPEGLPMVSHTFNEVGYRTAYFGKWHVDGGGRRAEDERSGKQFVPPQRRGGFGTWLAYENNNAQYDCWLHGHSERQGPVDLFRLPGYETDAITDIVIDYLEDHASHAGDQPFFAVMSVQPPHSPYVAPQAFTSRHRPEDIELRPNVPDIPRITDEARRDLAGYYAMIENLDWNVGRMIEVLRDVNLLDNTYVIYFSDHGDMHGSQGRIYKCVPWEESIRVPFLVSHGGRPLLPASDAPPLQTMINHVDIAPTSLGLCGLPLPDWMRGHDFSPMLRGETAKTPVPDSALLQLVDPGWRCGLAVDRERPWRGIVTEDGWKYAVLEGQPWLLYNLNEDPYELANLALDGRFRTERARLQERLVQWLSDVGDTFDLPKLPT